jgi:hypothetical protein
MQYAFVQKNLRGSLVYFSKEAGRRTLSNGEGLSSGYDAGVFLVLHKLHLFQSHDGVITLSSSSAPYSSLCSISLDGDGNDSFAYQFAEAANWSLCCWVLSGLLEAKMSAAEHDHLWSGRPHNGMDVGGARCHVYLPYLGCGGERSYDSHLFQMRLSSTYGFCQ